MQITMSMRDGAALREVPVGTLIVDPKGGHFKRPADTGLKHEPLWLATSTWRTAPVLFHSRPAAEYWLRTIGETEIMRQIREERAA